MTLPASGQLSFGAIASEMGGSAPYQMANYYKGGSFTTNYGSCPVPASGEIGFADFYGAKKNPCADGYTVNYPSANCQRVVVSSYTWNDIGFKSGGTRQTGNRSTAWQDSPWNGYPSPVYCNSGNVNVEVGDGSGRGGSYGDIGEAWPRYRIQGTKAQIGRPNPDSGQGARSGGTVRFYKCTENSQTQTVNFSSL